MMYYLYILNQAVIKIFKYLDIKRHTIHLLLLYTNTLIQRYMHFVRLDIIALKTFGRTFWDAERNMLEEFV